MRLTAQVGDTYSFWSPDGKDRIVVRFDEDRLYISREQQIIVLPRGTNVIEVPFNAPAPVVIE